MQMVPLLLQKDLPKSSTLHSRSDQRRIKKQESVKGQENPNRKIQKGQNFVKSNFDHLIKLEDLN